MENDNGEFIDLREQIPDKETTFPLGEEEMDLIVGIQRDGAILQGRLIGILDSFVRRHKLTGRWELAENGREIKKVSP